MRKDTKGKKRKNKRKKQDRGLDKAANFLTTLNSSEREILIRTLRELNSDGPTPTLDYVTKVDFRRSPVTIEEFLDNPYYIGSNTEFLRDVVRAELVDLFSPNTDYAEWYVTGALGWGKSAAVCLALAYIIYTLTCLRNPHQFFGLMPGGAIMIGVFSLSKNVAKDAIYTRTRNFIESSPYFQNKVPWDKQTQVRMRLGKKRNIELVPGSNFEHQIGRDLLVLAMDEANFYKETKLDANTGEEILVSEDLYDESLHRMETRFSNPDIAIKPLGILISSAQATDSMVERKLAIKKKAVKEGQVKVSAYKIWEALPEKYTFPGFKVEVGDATTPSRILENDEASINPDRVIEVPIELREKFYENLEKSIRNFAGFGTISTANFLSDPNVLKACVDLELEHPFTRMSVVAGTKDELEIDHYFKLDMMMCVQNSLLQPRRHPARPRFLHLDLARGKGSKTNRTTSDAVGMAMCHITGMKEINRIRANGTSYQDRAPIIEMDFMLRIVPPREGEIFFAKIRRFIFGLMDAGMPIVMVSSDGYQSVDMLQILGERCETRKFSVDKNDEPYATLKSAIVEGRFRYYVHPVFDKEVTHLIHNLDTAKIDHPARFTDGTKAGKDLADAVCGCVASAATAPSLRIGVEESIVAADDIGPLAQGRLSPKLLSEIERSVNAEATRRSQNRRRRNRLSK